MFLMLLSLCWHFPTSQPYGQSNTSGWLILILFHFFYTPHTHKCSSISGVLWPSHLHHASHLIHVGIVSRPFKPAKHGDKRRKKNPHSLFTSPHAASSSRGDSDVGSAFYLNACRQLQRASWRLKDTFIRLPAAAAAAVCVLACLTFCVCVCVCTKASRGKGKKERKKLNHRRRDVLYNPTASLLWHHTSLHSENSLHPEGAVSALEATTASTL